MKKKSSIWLLATAALVIPFTAFALLKLIENKWQPLPVLGGKEHRVSSFQLQNQHQQTCTQNAWKDKIVVVNFFFTHCPVVCPKMMKQMKAIQTATNRDTQIFLQSISVDPERDNPEHLRTYAEKNQITWNLMTGDKKQIYKLARNGFLLVATDGDGGPDDFIHSENLVLVDPQKRIRGYYNGTSPDEVKKLIQDIKKLKKESAP